MTINGDTARIGRTPYHKMTDEDRRHIVVSPTLDLVHVAGQFPPVTSVLSAIAAVAVLRSIKEAHNGDMRERLAQEGSFAEIARTAIGYLERYDTDIQVPVQ